MEASTERIIFGTFAELLFLFLVGVGIFWLLLTFATTVWSEVRRMWHNGRVDNYCKAVTTAAFGALMAYFFSHNLTVAIPALAINIGASIATVYFMMTDRRRCGAAPACPDRACFRAP